MNKESVLKSKNKKGFTLVELIVVLVILAILAAILIPALIGFIDRAREKQDVLDARNLLQATQAELTEVYAKEGDKLAWNTPIIASANGIGPTSDNGDVDISTTDFAKKVLKTADMEGEKQPYIFMVAVATNHANKSNASDQSRSVHQKYTVYYALYMKEEGSVPYYYYNGAWTKKNPRGLKKNNGGNMSNWDNSIMNAQNRIQTGSLKNMRLQYYLISYKGSYTAMSKDFWDYFKRDMEIKYIH
ncbi:MAG: prepilin-type N-terminal cleavage/methylation domain-containing protein [Lachnospiraceae bacterium]|nr:prepilin-type N-terminal cleavage/methylation domain-containing protein [Lachnospiraceae bacterium]